MGDPDSHFGSFERILGDKLVTSFEGLCEVPAYKLALGHVAVVVDEDGYFSTFLWGYFSVSA